MNNLSISACLALLFGVGLASFETLVNWGQWQWWPFWLVDYAAAALLILGGITTILKRKSGAKLLCAAWGFSLAMLWMSFAGNIADGTDPNRAAHVFGVYMGLIVISLVISLIGLILAIAVNQKQI